MKSNKELLTILRRLNELPVGELKVELDYSLLLKFDEWQRLTNEDLGFFVNYKRDAEEYVDKFENKTSITYDEYKKMQNLSITRELVGEPNIAKRAKKMEIAPEEIAELEEIEELWNNVRIKYDPIEEIKRLSHEVYNALYCCSLENVDDEIANVLNSINSLQRVGQYINEKYDKSQKYTDFESKVSGAMQQALGHLKTLKKSQELSVEEFMQELGLDSEEITQHYKDRLKLAEGRLSARTVFIKQKEGKAFKLNDNGDLEIIDESRAKSIIVSDFFSEVTKDTVDILNESYYRTERSRT